MQSGTRFTHFGALTVAVAAVGIATFGALALFGARGTGAVPAAQAAGASARVDGDSVTLTDAQARQIKVGPVLEHDFVPRHETEGFVDFDQDRSVQVFSPWAGRIARVLARAGDDVRQGQWLFTIESPDLVSAEQSLIAAAGVLKLTTQALERAREMFESQSIAQKDLDQAVSDQQTAQGNLDAARAAVRIFGKTEAEMDQIIASRSTAAELRIASPIAGRVTARNAAPGLLVQPGNAPAPFMVADISTMWMIASVAEDELPYIRLGEPVEATLAAFPGRTFEGRVGNIGASVDPNTHRVTVRSEIRDPGHELRPQMLGTFVIRTGAPVRSPALPLDAVVREGDGTMEAFVTADGRRFVRRPLKLGMQRDGLDQVLAGVTTGERVATENALFLANELARQTP
ncbi:MAG: efflux RND transporter periplasmic adaptor subunit [Burkholderiaceae bacterium]|nr:efflux RND transporter periplasmic adaptor subunit [Burkholderiaceae bacterium]